MKQNKKKLLLVLGWILILIALGLLSIQLIYLILHRKFQIEYIDNRLFYIINIFVFICIFISLRVLNVFKEKLKALSAILFTLLVVFNIVLSIQDNRNIKNIVSISPDFKHVFSVKSNQKNNEAIYYRDYYKILARPKEIIELEISDNNDIKWLANDIAVLTSYDGEQPNIFIGTYGDRNDAVSYYYVAAEIQGIWENEDVRVKSSPDGVQITENNRSIDFQWKDIEQYGTLAIVLRKDHEDSWVIALNKDFKVQSDASKDLVGSISLYNASPKNTKVYNLGFISRTY
ncbi:MAG: hypothetical protein GX752_00400 [Clostridium sp.]|nr:hypothetical protein [Clostridium sp.]